MNINQCVQLRYIFFIIGFINVNSIRNINDYHKFCQISDSHTALYIICQNFTFSTLMQDISSYYGQVKINLTLKQAYLEELSSRNFTKLGVQNKNITFLNNTIEQLYLDEEVLQYTFRNNKIKNIFIHEHSLFDSKAPFNIDLSNNKILNFTNTLDEITDSNNILSIDLSNCSLRKIPDGLIFISSRLETITLSYNKFSCISEKSFQVPYFMGCKQKLTININYCDIEQIENRAFVDICVHLLNLSHNKIQTLLSNVFVDCRINFLNLSYNRIKNLNNIDLSTLGAHIRKLDLQHNKIEILREGIFKKNIRLRYLNLLNNPIKLIESSAFLGLVNIEHSDLLLPVIKLRQIQNHTFYGLNAMTNLHLSNRGIQEISPGAFKGLGQLTNLHLNHNNISSLAPGVFNGLHSIIRIDLSHNSISNLDSVSFRGVQVVYPLHINMNNNKIVKIPDGFFHDTPTLFELRLKHNRIEKLQKGVFANLKFLSILNLAINDLEEVDIDIFEETNLVSLDISYNYLTEFNLKKLLQKYKIVYLNINNNAWNQSYQQNMIEILDKEKIDYTNSSLNEDNSYEVRNTVTGNVNENNADKEIVNYPTNNTTNAVVWIICVGTGILLLFCIAFLIHLRRKRLATSKSDKSIVLLNKASNMDNSQVQLITDGSFSD